MWTRPGHQTGSTHPSACYTSQIGLLRRNESFVSTSSTAVEQFHSYTLVAALWPLTQDGDGAEGETEEARKQAKQTEKNKRK
jgi:hypothetical protein